MRRDVCKFVVPTPKQRAFLTKAGVCTDTATTSQNAIFSFVETSDRADESIDVVVTTSTRRVRLRRIGRDSVIPLNTVAFLKIQLMVAIRLGQRAFHSLVSDRVINNLMDYTTPLHDIMTVDSAPRPADNVALAFAKRRALPDDLRAAVHGHPFSSALRILREARVPIGWLFGLLADDTTPQIVSNETADLLLRKAVVRRTMCNVRTAFLLCGRENEMESGLMETHDPIVIGSMFVVNMHDPDFFSKHRAIEAFTGIQLRLHSHARGPQRSLLYTELVSRAPLLGGGPSFATAVLLHCRARCLRRNSHPESSQRQRLPFRRCRPNTPLPRPPRCLRIRLRSGVKSSTWCRSKNGALSRKSSGSMWCSGRGPCTMRARTSCTRSMRGSVLGAIKYAKRQTRVLMRASVRSRTDWQRNSSTRRANWRIF